MNDTHRPDLLAEVLRVLGGGRVMIEASKDLALAVEATRFSGKTSTVTIKITVAAAGGPGEGTYKLEGTSAAKLAKPESQPTIMFGTPDNNLVRDDPAQGNLFRQGEDFDPATGAITQQMKGQQ